MEKSMKLEVENEKELVKVDDLGRVTLRLKLREKHGGPKCVCSGQNNVTWSF